MDLPSEEALRWLVTRYAALRSAHGEAIGAPALVQPTGDFFPDEFTHDGESVARLLARMTGYTPLADDLAVAVRFFEPDASTGTSGGGCSSGGCSTDGGGAARGLRNGVVELDNGYVVEVDVADVRHPVLLTTSLARSVGALVLAEAGEEVDVREAGAMREVAAAVCGLGVLVVAGAYVYGKSCGGARVHQGTTLSVEETAVLLSLFIRLHDIKAPAARTHLETTQREALDLALEWIDSNPAIVTGLRERPELLAEGMFAVEPVRGLFGRLFTKRKGDPPMPTWKSTPRRVRTDEEQKRLEEARALVEEALREQ